MKTGVIIEIKNGQAVILKRNGEFVLMESKEEWKLGEVILLKEEKQNHWRSFCVAACFLILSLIGYNGLQFYLAPVSFVSIDINPSIELSLNRLDRVVKVSVFNEEGSKIISQLNLNNLVYSRALERLWNTEELAAYFETDSNIVVTVSSASEQKQLDLFENVQSATDTLVLDHYQTLKPEYHLVSVQTVEGAHEHGMTAGKYLYLQQLQELNPDIDLTEYSHHNIGQIRNQIQECKNKNLNPPQPEQSQCGSSCHGNHHHHSN